jgi:hypothetical protein
MQKHEDARDAVVLYLMQRCGITEITLSYEAIADLQERGTVKTINDLTMSVVKLIIEKH